MTQVKDFLAQLLHPQYAPNNDFCAVFLLEQPSPTTGGTAGAAEADGASAASSSARDAAGIREAALRAKDAAAMAHETRAFLTGELVMLLHSCSCVCRIRAVVLTLQRAQPASAASGRPFAPEFIRCLQTATRLTHTAGGCTTSRAAAPTPSPCESLLQ